MAESSKSRIRTLFIALAMAIFFGTLASTVSVLLAPRQAENLGGERKAALDSLLVSDPDLAATLEGATENTSQDRSTRGSSTSITAATYRASMLETSATIRPRRSQGIRPTGSRSAPTRIPPQSASDRIAS